jgi:FMN phosphatase YigB (HAD superfamily)
MLGAMVAEDVCALAADYFGLRVDDVLADLEQSCRRMELCDPAVVDTLRRISERGIRVVLATDNMDAFRRWTIPALQLDTVFDVVLTSDACGALKTDLVDGLSPFFSPWLADCGIAPSEAMLIDDTRVAAAEAIGIVVRLVEDPSNLVAALAKLARTTF